MAISPNLWEELVKAKSMPSRAYRTAAAGIGAADQTIQGFREGGQIGDEIRKRQLAQQTLADALHGQSVEQGIMNFTGETGQAQDKNLATLAAYLKAKEEKAKKGAQIFGIQGTNGLVFDPNTSTVSTTPLPTSDQPILPKAVSPTLSPYADPTTGQPLAFTPGRGLAPTPSVGRSRGTPVLKQGNEQAISDVALMQTQAPNIDKLFDAYATKTPIMAKLQATPVGNVLDPVAKQAENALKLSAFTFGGKNLTGQEKQVVFGAFFPSVTDNEQSREAKRTLLKDYFAGKIDLLQAANLLGPAGAPLSHMLQSKQQNIPNNSDQSFSKTFASEEEANSSGYKGPAMIAGKRAVIH